MKKFFITIVSCGAVAYLLHIFFFCVFNKTAYHCEPDMIFLIIFAGLAFINLIIQIKMNYHRRYIMLGRIKIFLFDLSRCVAGIFI